MSQLGSITAEKEKQMDLERQRFQEVKAKMLAQQKYKRAARTAGHIVLNIVVALIVLLPLLYAVSIAFMPSGELFTCPNIRHWRISDRHCRRFHWFVL